MQPTVQSQARLRRLVWLMSALLILVVAGGAVQFARLGAEIERLKTEAHAAAAALADARQAAAGLRFSLRGAEERVKAAEGARAKAEAAAKSTDAELAELEARLRAAEAARAEAETRLRSVLGRHDTARGDQAN